MKKKTEDSLCLCGSGKQYKNCCFEKLIEFPKNNSFKDLPDYDSDFDYNSDSDSDYNSEISNSIKAHIENKEFSSLEELNQALNQFSHNYNKKPRDDFLGLSPSQMRDTLDNPFSLKNKIFVFEYGNYFEKNIKEIPFLEQAIYFLNKLYESGEMKATQKGNLPKAFVMELYQKFFSKEYIFIPYREDYLPEATRLKHVLNMAGLIKKRQNKFYLTKKGETLIKDKNIRELFDKLILTYFKKWNWGFLDGYSELSLIQESAIFNIYLLSKKAKNWILDEELGRVFFKAFPALAFDVNKRSYFDPKTEVINCFNVRFLERVCLPLGWLKKKSENRSIERKTYYKLSPFFKQHFKFTD